MGNNQNGLPLIPQIPLIDVVEVLETRNLNFNKEFSFEYCDEVASALEKVMQYDKLVGTPKDGLYLRITLSTPGGYVYGLMKVLEKVEKMKERGYTVHTHISNWAASCGFILFCSGNYKTVSPYASAMNHQPSSGMWGTLKDQEVSLNALKKLDDVVLDYIRKNTRLSEEEIQRPYVTNTDIWYNAEECVEIGLADAIKLY